MASVETSMWVRHFSWIPPVEPDAWKLNFAGYFIDEDMVAGTGCILRDQNGVFVAACAGPVKKCGTPTMAHLMALEQGLDVAMRLGVDYLEVEGEHPDVIRMIQRTFMPSTPGMAILLDRCFDLLDGFRKVMVRRIHHLSNEAANVLAAKGRRLEELVHWNDEPPSDIAPVLVTDVIGQWVHRRD
ncbi:hypothetical protein ACJRO7_014837 [Eucalyptus globulus]|uniref:RNase H type-1 domain-containing protein n=1 Tax=Eucalyptus globulus TaxID=34317 RepID=A0ABD3LC44_EUCGL